MERKFYPESITKKSIESLYEGAKELTFIVRDVNKYPTTAFWPYRNESTVICTAYTEEPHVFHYRHITWNELHLILEWMSGNSRLFDTPVHVSSWITRIEFLNFLGLEDLRHDYSKYLSMHLLRLWKRNQERVPCVEAAANFACECIHSYAERGLGLDMLLDTCFWIIRQDVHFFRVKKEKIDVLRRGNMFERILTMDRNIWDEFDGEDL